MTLAAVALPAGLSASPLPRSTHLVLRARDRLWLRISPENQTPQALVLQGGARIELVLATRTRVWTNDAGCLEILVDGVRLPPLGPEGQRARLLIDPQSGTFDCWIEPQDQ